MVDWQQVIVLICARMRIDSRATLFNNVSSDDKIVWDWDIGSKLSGQVGANYGPPHWPVSLMRYRLYTQQSWTVRLLRGGSVSTWTALGGLRGFVGTNTHLSAAASKANDSNQNRGFRAGMRDKC